MQGEHCFGLGNKGQLQRTLLRLQRLHAVQLSAMPTRLYMRCAGSDSCQPLALAKVAVYAQFEGAFSDLALLILRLNVLLSLVHVNCQVLEISGQRTCLQRR